MNLLRVFGSIELTGPEGDPILSVLSQPKRVALFAYLALARPRGFSRRDTLLGLFWPESDQQSARASLSTALSFIRKSLGEEVILRRGTEEVSIDPAHLWTDVDAFEEALEGQDPKSALEEYRGHLLEGFFLSGCPEFEHWLSEERERLRELAAGAAWELAHRQIEAGELVPAERTAQKALGWVPTDESRIRAFVEALARSGDRAAAVRFHEKFSAKLAEELELRPDAESRALVERIRDSLEVWTSGASTSRSPEPDRESRAEPHPSSDPPADGGLGASDADARLEGLRSALADRYRIEREIGRGGMATVYLARDKKHDRQVAVKVFDPELAQALWAERFLREIKTAANLAHPHILPVFDSGQADGFLFYVMPYVEGESLRTRLTKEKQLPVEDALQITREVADALAFAHEKGVIHRDVKPANILLEAGHAVLADFGVAQAVAEAGEDRLTRSGASLGTPPYMSPEQATGERELDGRSDQYALGCVLYEMLAGQPPFTGVQADAVIRLHISEEPPSVARVRPSVPGHVVEGVNRALSKSPADRFRTTREMGKAFTLAAVPEDRKGRWGRTKTAIYGGMVIVALATVTVVASLRKPETSMSRERVVVLPFENRTGDPDLETLGSRGAEHITTGLNWADLDRFIEVIQFSDVMLTARLASSTGGEPSSFQDSWPRETGATLAVVGSFYLDADSVYFQINTVDRENTVRSAMTVSSEASAAPSEWLIALQARGVQAVAEVVAPEHELVLSLEGRHPPHPEALQLTMDGWALALSRQSAPISKTYFQRAIDLDRDYLLPPYLLTVTHRNLGEFAAADSLCRVMERRVDEMAPHELDRTEWVCAMVRGENFVALEAVKRMAARSLNNASVLGGAYMAVNQPRAAADAFSRYDPELGGRITRLWDTEHRYNWARAHHVLGEFSRELEIVRTGRAASPEHPGLINHEIRALIGLDSVREAEALIEDRLSRLRVGQAPTGILNNAAREFDAHGYREKARELWERLLQWYSGFSPESEPVDNRRGGTATLLFLGRIEEADATVESLTEDFPENLGDQGRLGVLRAMQGDSAAAEAVSALLRDWEAPFLHGYNTLWRARIAAHLGDPEAAVRLLELAMAQGWEVLDQPHRDPYLRPLRRHPAFQEFLRPKG